MDAHTVELDELDDAIEHLGRAAAQYRLAAAEQWTDAARRAAPEAAIAQWAPQLSSLPAAQLPDVAAHLWAMSALLDGGRWRRLHGQLEACRPSPCEAPSLPAVAEPLVCRSWERLLCAYDLQQRRERSVYVTPGEVVDFLVRAADSLLRTSLQLPAGLAHDGPDRCLRIVDPAAGCGPFLLQAARQIVGRASADLASRTLLGLECLPGSAALANGLLADALRVPYESPVPEVVRWADALCETDPLPWFDGRAPVLTVIGNPPYANYGRRNRSPWILRQLQAYKRGLRERKHNLDDDFVKFWRWAEHHVLQAGAGVVALITSSTYLRGLTHRLMRRSLLSTFGQALVLDLHGEQFRGSSGGSGRDADDDAGAGDEIDGDHNGNHSDGNSDASNDVDENVFDIRQGVALGLFVRRRDEGPGCEVFHAELRGSRADKLQFLAERDLEDVNWQRITPRPPLRRLVPEPQAAASYDSWPGLDELLLHYVSGVQSKCDRFFIGRDRQQLADRVCAAIEQSDARQDLPAWLRRRLAAARFDSDCLRRCLVAPLDRRWIYYDPRLLGRARHQVLRHLAPGGRALVFMRQSTNDGVYDHFLVCNCLATDRVFHSRHGAPFIAPWRLGGYAGGPLNVSRQAWRLLSREPADDEPPEDVLHYVAAVMHSVRYRERFQHRLQTDFPRIPPSRDEAQFQRLASLGRRLVSRWCDEASDASPPIELGLPSGEPCEVAAGCPRASAVDAETTEVRINSRDKLRLPAAAWNWQVGGVAVLRHWLASRRGQPLSAAERQEFGRLAATATDVLDLQREIDEVVTF